MLALTALGYWERELTKIRPQLADDDQLQSTEQYMKKAIQLLLTLK